MKSIVIRTAAATLLAASVLPAFAQERAAPNPYVGAGEAPVCTQLELSAGLRGDECGKLSLSEVVALKIDRDNTN